MKKAAFLICGLFLALTLFGCNNTPNDTDESVTFRLVKQTTIDKNESTTVATFEYNEAGQMVKYEIHADGVLNTQNEVAYDENGFKNYEKSTTPTGLVTELFYENDINGRAVKQRMVTSFMGASSESISEFEYTDAYGSYVQTFVSGSYEGNTTTVTKDEHGNQIANSTTNGTSVRYENTYDGERLIARTAVRETPSGDVLTSIEYEYDVHGNLIKETTYDEIGRITLTQIYEYLTVTTKSQP